MGENFKVLERECQVFGNKKSGSCHSTVLSGRNTVKKKGCPKLCVGTAFTI